MCPKKTKTKKNKKQTVDTKVNNKMGFEHVTVYFTKASNVFNSPGCFSLLVKKIFSKCFFS